MYRKIPPIIIFICCCFHYSLSSAQAPINDNLCTQIQCVKVQNGHLWVLSSDDLTYVPYFIKAVGYQPMPIGRHPSDWGYAPSDLRYNINNIYDDLSILNRDFPLLQQMNANTIRIWKGDNTTEVNGRYPNKLTMNTLDTAQKYNLKVIAGFWVNTLTFDFENNIGSLDGEGHPISRQDIINNFADFVNTFKGSRAVLFWAIGNENNLQNNLHPWQLAAWYSLVNDMAFVAHQQEGAFYHPVAVVNGEIAEIGNSSLGAADLQMPSLDIWGVNAYRGKSFGTLFRDFSRKSHKPLWISEFGLDAWTVKNATGINNWQDNPKQDTGFEDQTIQSVWDTSLWNEIFNNSSTSVGGSVMEYSDEWWKPYEWFCTVPNPNNDPAIQAQNARTVAECLSTHNHFGSPFPAFPDHFMNQEWFGIMSISDNPISGAPDNILSRKVYNSLKILWQADPFPRLTLNLTGPGIGSFTSSPGSINCTSGSPGGCTAQFPKGQSIALYFYSPHDNSYVSNWGGCHPTSPRDCVVTLNQNIVVNIAVGLYAKITASAQSGGMIRPSGTVDVVSGTSQVFTIIPNPHYRISQVIVDGSAVKSPSSTYKFTHVTGTHTITATFVAKQSAGLL